MDADGKTCKTVGWNGLVFDCPENWEIFVSSKKHLVFETDFQPVFELRWHANKKDRHATVLRNLQQESDLEQQEHLPSFWETLTESYTVSLLTEKNSGTLKSALLTCRKCHTSILLLFFADPAGSMQDFHNLLRSLACHPENENDDILWAIQDFQLKIPNDFLLDNYSFAAGLSRLSFSRTGITLYVCRLATAAERLQAASLAEIMFTLGDIPVDTAAVSELDNAVWYQSQPTIFQQILLRCKRKMPFCWMTLRHHLLEDRLTGLFFEDKKPLPEKTIHAILASYEIIPL